MGVRRSTSYSETDVTLVTTAETVVGTITGIATNQPGQTVGVRGKMNITLGTNTTAIVMRVRRDNLTGTQVGETQTEQISSAAGSTEDHEIYREDLNAGEFSGRTYVVTVSQTAASANGTVNNGSVEVEITP
jgi:hypothetical protein